MDTIPGLPKYPPLGDVTTTIGIFRLVARSIHLQIDNRLRYEYPDCTDTIDCFTGGLEAICNDDPHTIEKQLMRVISMITSAIATCTNAECKQSGNHELMLKIIVLIRDTPSMILEEMKVKGRIPGFSMN